MTCPRFTVSPGATSVLLRWKYDVTTPHEPVDQCHHSAVRSANLLAGGAAKIDAKVTSRESAIEQPPRPELTRDHRFPRPEKRLRPHRRVVVRVLSHIP